MSKRHVLFFGNCQANALSQVYRLHLSPEKGDQVSFADSQSILTTPLEAAALLREADVVVNQIFDFPTKVKADDLKPGCVILNFPSVNAPYYWPHANQPHVRMPKSYPGAYPTALGDRFLNGLLVKGVDPRSALEQYLLLDIVKTTNLERFYEVCIEAQQKRDKQCDFDIAGLMIRYLQSEPLFLTSGHPTLRVFCAVARQVYAMLDVADSYIAEALDRLQVTPFPLAALPIHPKVIEFFRLGFVNSNTRYPFFNEGSFSFEEYVLRYMNCEWNEPLWDAFTRAEPPAAKLATLDQGLVKSPASAAGWRLRAELLAALGRTLDAMGAASRAVDLDPDEPQNWKALCEAAIAIGDLEGARTKLAEALRLFPKEAALHRVAADLASKSGNKDNALFHARAAVQLLPGDAKTHACLGAILARWRDFAEAAVSYRRAIEIEPRARSCQVSLVEVLERLGRAAEAAEGLRALSDARNEEGHLYWRIGKILLDQGESGRAEEAIRSAIALSPDPPGYHHGLAAALGAQGRLEEAKAILERLVSKESTNPHLLLHYGQIQRRQGDLAGAEQSFRTAMALDPDADGFRRTLAAFLKAQGRVGEAEAIPGGAGV